MCAFKRINVSIKIKDTLFIVLLGFVCFLILWLIYGDIVISPNSFMLSKDGEAIRSYLVMDQFGKGDSWIESTCMNYPYGEHITYTDGQPFFAFIFKGICSVIPAFSNYSVGFMNAISLYSMILGTIFIYHFLRKLEVPIFYSLFISIAIMMLGPQVVKIRWQPALANAFVIPLVLIVLNNYLKKISLKTLLILSIVVLLAFFIHPYLGLMSTIFVMIAYLIHWYINKHQTNWKQRFYHLITLFLPPILFIFYLKLTDSHLDRVDSPTGIVKFSSNLTSIFTSIQSPFAEFYYWITNQTETEAIENMEGWAYIGLPTSLFIIYWIIRRIYLLISRKENNLYVLPERFKILLITSIILLIGSFALPFKWFPESIELLDYIKPLKQFRALGRFSWFFVYISISAFGLILYFWIKNTEKKSIKIVLQIIFVLSFSTLLYEGTFLHLESAKESNTRNEFNSANQIPLPEKEFQAIIPVPYYHIGSHRFEPKSSPPLSFITETILFSQKKSLPLTSSFFSRNSKSESIKSFRLFSHHLLSKEILSDFSDDPLLIYHNKKYKISQEEKNFLSRGKVIFSNDSIIISEINIADIPSNDLNDLFKSFNDYKDSYVQNENFYINKDGWMVNNNFEEEKFKNGFNGNALFLDLETDSLLFDQSEYCPKINDDIYKISFWINHNNHVIEKQLFLETADNYSGNILEKKHLHWAIKSFNIIGDWMLCEFDIHLTNDKNVKLYFRQTNNEIKSPVIVDNLQIRSKETSIFEHIENNKWMWNNFPVNLNEKGLKK